MLLLTLGACFVMFICVTANPPLPTPRHCDDCIPYTYCAKARNLFNTMKTEETVELIRGTFCGFDNTLKKKSIVKICCGEYDDIIPNFTNRFVEHPNLQFLPEACGIIATDKVVGGSEAGIYEFPWMAVIVYDDDRFGCAGTLINSRYVLTAAHCVANKFISYVRIGDFNLMQDVDCQGNICEKGVQNVQVKQEEIHKEYNMYTYENDIALLYLNSSVSFPHKNVMPICLPTTKDMQENSIVNTMATVCGWGLNENGTWFSVLRKVDIPVLSAESCDDFYGNSMSQSNQTRFCAGQAKKDACKGDSGGPLMISSEIRNSTRVVQYGIVSLGPKKCGVSGPGIYTDVRKYMNWILDHIME